MNKIAIIGAGRVGESTAQFLAEQNICKEIVLLDIREGAAEGAALDIQEVAPMFGYDTRIHGSSNPSIITDADLCIITAGMPRKPGMSRSDLLEANIKIVDGILNDIMHYAITTKLLFVTNPVDIITYYAYKKTGWNRSRIFGQAGVLDSGRMASFIAMETGYSVLDINTLVLGGHGDTMVPLTRFTSIGGIPVGNFLSVEALDRIVERTRNGGAEILALRKESSAYDAPAAAIVEMVEAIVLDRRRVIPTVCILQGEFEEYDIAIGIPAVLGEHGIQEMITIDLNESEQEMFDYSVSQIRKDLKILETLCKKLNVVML